MEAAIGSKRGLKIVSHPLGAWHSARALSTHSICPLQKALVILSIRKLWLREVGAVACGHSAQGWRSQKSNPACLMRAPLLPCSPRRRGSWPRLGRANTVRWDKSTRRGRPGQLWAPVPPREGGCVPILRKDIVSPGKTRCVL